MKADFPGFAQCMEFMRDPDPFTREGGFDCLRPYAAAHIHELMEEFGREAGHGLRCWLLELIASARSPAAFDLLAEQLRGPSPLFWFWAIRGLMDLDTEEAWSLLRQAHSWPHASPEETEQFRSALRVTGTEWDEPDG
jgi:hypothetical protein